MVSGKGTLGFQQAGLGRFASDFPLPCSELLLGARRHGDRPGSCVLFMPGRRATPGVSPSSSPPPPSSSSSSSSPRAGEAHADTHRPLLGIFSRKSRRMLSSEVEGFLVSQGLHEAHTDSVLPPQPTPVKTQDHPSLIPKAYPSLNPYAPHPPP